MAPNTLERPDNPEPLAEDLDKTTISPNTIIGEIGEEDRGEPVFDPVSYPFERPHELKEDIVKIECVLTDEDKDAITAYMNDLSAVEDHSRYARLGAQLNHSTLLDQMPRLGNDLEHKLETAAAIVEWPWLPQPTQYAQYFANASTIKSLRPRNKESEYMLARVKVLNNKLYNTMKAKYDPDAEELLDLDVALCKIDPRHEREPYRKMYRTPLGSQNHLRVYAEVALQRPDAFTVTNALEIASRLRYVSEARLMPQLVPKVTERVMNEQKEWAEQEIGDDFATGDLNQGLRLAAAYTRVFGNLKNIEQYKDTIQKYIETLRQEKKWEELIEAASYAKTMVTPTSAWDLKRSLDIPHHRYSAAS